ncbi:MAG: hypothetical protein MRZ39_06980 [Oscillospiraceae bacterium]|nr:hypothetical protein [Oscillospiraceae bacterium]
MAVKMVLDETNGVLTLNGVPIDPINDTKIKIDNFYDESEVTLTFLADVTLIPPKRDSNGNVIFPR